MRTKKYYLVIFEITILVYCKSSTMIRRKLIVCGVERRKALYKCFYRQTVSNAMTIQKSKDDNVQTPKVLGSENIF